MNISLLEMTGYSPADVIEKRVSYGKEIIHPDDQERVWNEAQGALGDRKSFQLTYRIRTAEGEERWIWDQGRGIYSSDGHLLKIEGFSTDITEPKRVESDKEKLELQLIQAQKMESIGRLAGGVAHDFNNMLGVILGYAELIRTTLPYDDPILKNLSEIEKAATRSKNTTQQLLAFSRKQIVSAKPIDLNDRITDTQKTLARLIGEDVGLRFYPSEDLWKIKFDISQVDQIIINLAVNARDAMPSGGNLKIETHNRRLGKAACEKHLVKPGDYVELLVNDNGVGMDKKTLSNIFEPFFTTKNLGKGTGLGLAMVYGVVKQCGGFIDVESKSGYGATFKVYFPRFTDDEAFPENTIEMPLFSATGTILLVEDDELVRNMVQAMLNKIGYKVLVAKSPMNALSICKSFDKSIDMLLTDVVMPEMTGIGLKNRIRSILPGMKVLFMSGYSEDIIVLKGIENENVHFIQKPFNVDTLARKIIDVIAA